MSAAYDLGYEAGSTDADEAVRENGSVGDVDDGSSLRESAREAYVTNRESCDQGEYVEGYCAAWERAAEGEASDSEPDDTDACLQEDAAERAADMRRMAGDE